MEDFMPGVVEQFVRENSMQISANCSGIVRSVLVPKVKTESPTLVAHGNRDMVKTFDKTAENMHLQKAKINNGIAFVWSERKRAPTEQ